MFKKGKNKNNTYYPTIQRQPGLPFWYIFGTFSPNLSFVVKN